MTHRLYYDDPTSVEFDATVVRAEPRGVRQAIWLDRTGFYPTSGGQPFDTGSLGPHPVVEVAEEEDGAVVHIVEPAGGGVLRVQDRVHGIVDWPRRFDHMQQHTGQHLLSAAFERLFRNRTVGFHLGGEASTIDLAREMTPAEIQAAGDEANRIVWEDRAVAIRYASAEEASAMPLRKEPVRGGTLRLIEVEGFDLSACGGTHVGRTGAVGVIVVAGWERFKGGQRLEFLCGGRALMKFRLLRDATALSVRRLSVLPGDLPAAIERLQTELKEQRRSLNVLNGEVGRYRARELAAAAESHPCGKLVLKAMEADAGSLREMAMAITSLPGFLAVLVSNSRPALIVASRSADVGVPCDAIVTRLAQRFGGRGGGAAGLAQGGGLHASPEEILAAVRELLLALP